MKVILAYKNFAANRNISVISGWAWLPAINTAKVAPACGYQHGKVLADLSPADLAAKLKL